MGLKQLYVDTTTNPPGDSTYSTLLLDTPAPRSKTSIGRLNYSLTDTPKLLVVVLVVESETPNVVTVEKEQVWEPFHPAYSKLRRKVAVKYMRAAGQRFDMLYVPRDVNEYGWSGIVHAIIRIRDEKHRAAVKESLKVGISRKSCHTRGLGGVARRLQTRCTVRGFLEDDTTGIRALLRIAARKPGFLRPLTGYTRAVDARFQDTAPNTSTAFPLYVQVHPHVDSKNIDLDFELVSCIPTLSGPGLLSSMLCVNEPNVEDIAKCFKRFKRMLCGMNARCLYKPEGRSAAGRAKVKLLMSDDTTGRVFQIKDVMLPGDPGTSFEIDGVSRSIYDYFKDVILPNGRTLKTNFPLVRDDSCALIPLELLVFDGPQPLHGLDYRNEAMRDIIRTFLKKGGIDCLQALAKDLLGLYATIESDDGIVSQPWLDARLTTVKDADRSVVAQGSIKIASIVSTGTHDVELIKRLTRGLVFHQYEVIDNPVMITCDDPHRKLEDPKCDLLLVIVDNRSSNKNEIGASTSLLRRTAELKWGTRVICLNRKNLLSMFNNRYDSGTYFPSSIRGKINCMLGQQNFNEARLEKALDCSTTMIVGAHITYASINERYGTSIAGVVATTPKSIVQFAGTARLQNTDILEIKSLGVMMLDLFKNWKDGAPTELIFFRDSAGLSEIDGIFDIECLKIEGAYNTTFPGRDAKSDLNLIYILVKMVKENSLESSVSNQVPYYLPESNRSKKYKYFIIRNDSNRDDLAHVTGRLNESSQLNPHSEQQTSKSLPIIHASKLCGRMQDYVRLNAHLGEVNMPKILPIARTVNNRNGKEYMTGQEAINVLLDTHDKVSRRVPWHMKLDGTMFYL